MSNITCPYCNSESICVLSWVGENGEVLEAAGDYVLVPKEEPKPLCFCSDCDKYWSPNEHHWFTIEEGVPYERCAQAQEGTKLGGCPHDLEPETWGS